MTIERILGRLEALIMMGERVLSTRHPPPPHVITSDGVDEALFRQWHTSTLALFNTLPSDYVYGKQFETHCRAAYHYEAERGLAVLRAAQEDIKGGYLQKIESLVSADIFTDFLDMAEHLLDNGYKDPAASLIGAVLEDGLRQICRSNNNITVKQDDNISSLNQKIADSKIYNRLLQRQIEAWNKLRDYADHGHFTEYKIDNVKDMLGGVRKFLSDFLD